MSIHIIKADKIITGKDLTFNDTEQFRLRTERLPHL